MATEKKKSVYTAVELMEMYPNAEEKMETLKRENPEEYKRLINK